MAAWQESDSQDPPHPQILEELQQAKIKAEQATEAKSRFLARMSHEIRTPLTAMLGYADLLSEFDLTLGERRNAMDALRNNGQHLLKILDDIIDLSRVEAGQLSVERIRCRPTEVLEEVVRLMTPRAELKGLSLVLESHPKLPAMIQTDPTRLKQILANLISNALKFTTRGNIRLVVRPGKGAEAYKYLAFDVIDQGIGISESQQKRLFQPYAQADETIHRRFGGTGLGLAISQQLAEMLGGTIRCKSALGQGSTFTVTIATGLTESEYLLSSDENPQDAGPDERPEPSFQEEPDDEELEPAAMPNIPSLLLNPEQLLQDDEAQVLRAPRVLVAEDYPDNLRLIGYLLHKCGAHVQEAQHGRIAVEKALEAWRAGDPFDVVLMDMEMPEMDGFAATKHLRQQGYPGTIIALTAHTMAGDRDRCLAAGCDDYISKPLAPGVFWRVLARHLHFEHSAPARSNFPPGVG